MLRLERFGQLRFKPVWDLEICPLLPILSLGVWELGYQVAKAEKTGELVFFAAFDEALAANQDRSWHCVMRVYFLRFLLYGATVLSSKFEAFDVSLIKWVWMSDTQWVSWALKRWKELRWCFLRLHLFRQLRNCMGRTSAVMPRREPQEVRTSKDLTHFPCFRGRKQGRQIGRKQTQAKWNQKSHGVAKTYLNLMPFWSRKGIKVLQDIQWDSRPIH